MKSLISVIALVTLLSAQGVQAGSLKQRLAQVSQNDAIEKIIDGDPKECKPTETEWEKDWKDKPKKCGCKKDWKCKKCTKDWKCKKCPKDWDWKCKKDWGCDCWKKGCPTCPPITLPDSCPCTIDPSSGAPSDSG